MKHSNRIELVKIAFSQTDSNNIPQDIRQNIAEMAAWAAEDVINKTISEEEVKYMKEMRRQNRLSTTN